MYSLKWILIKFEHKWNFDELSPKPSLPWSLQLIERYKDEWDWIKLTYNECIVWSLELLEKFENKWSLSSLAWNKRLWVKVLKPFVNDSMIEAVMEKIEIIHTNRIEKSFFTGLKVEKNSNTGYFGYEYTILYENNQSIYKRLAI